MFKKIALFVIVSCITLQQSIAQSDGSEFLKVIPPSPEASSLGKYGDHTVSLYTGQQQINIPIFNISEGDINLPVSLSYSTGGFKVDEVASWVGLGWALNAGGVVSRSMRGLPDEFDNGFLEFRQTINLTSFYQGTNEQKFLRYDALARNCSDSEPDLFYFNFSGHTGKFAYDWNGNIIVDSNEKITVTPIGLSIGSQGYIQGWEIKVASGLTYRFEEKEMSHIDDFTTNLGNCAENLTPVTAWYLTKITSPSSDGEINFEYNSYHMRYNVLASESKTHDPVTGIMESSTTNIFPMDILGRRIKKITSSQFIIEFNPGSTKRTDIESLLDASYGDNNLYRLGSIVVSNKAGTVIKTLKLEHDPSTSARLTLKYLKQVATINAIEVVDNQYSFEYNGLMGIGYLSKSQDHWGYANTTNNTSLIPELVLPTANGEVIMSGGNRESSFSGSKAGVLQKITYPTGGSTSFEYELNDFSANQSGEIHEYQKIPRAQNIYAVGGTAGPNQSTMNFEISSHEDKVRVEVDLSIIRNYKQDFGGAYFKPYIKLFDSQGTMLKEWRYPQFSGTSYETVFLPSGQYSVTAYAELEDLTDHTKDYASVYLSWDDQSQNLITPIKNAGGVRISRSVEYDGISHTNDIIKKYEYRKIEGGGTKSTGIVIQNDFDYFYYGQIGKSGILLYEIENKLIRLSSNRTALGLTQGSPIGYSHVTVKYGDNAENGSTIHKFTTALGNPDAIYNALPFPPSSSKDYKRGLLLERTDYSSTGALLKKSEFQYESIVTEIPGIKVGWQVPGDMSSGADYLWRYAIGGYSTNLGYSQSTKEIETTYESSGTLITERDIVFDNINKVKIEESTKGSSGELNTIKFYYPSDFSSSDFNGSIGDLTSRHMHGVVIEKNLLLNSKVSDGVRNQFILNGSKMVLSKIDKIELTEPKLRTSLLSTDYENQLSIQKCDASGNALTIKPKSEVLKSYVWGYFNELPIAEIVNADADLIFHTSFEEESTGFTLEGKTGKKSKTSGFNKTLTQLTAGDYKLSYWQKQAGTWVLTEQTITISAPTSSYSISLSGQLDEIRFYPKYAMMTTFTYEPGIGVTSQCDVNNTVTYYEYDPFGRLALIKDDKQNIVKTFTYNFKD